MAFILSKSRFSQNIVTQLLLLRPPYARQIPSKCRNYSQSVDADSINNSKKNFKIALWSSVGACSIAFFAFQTSYFHQIIDKTRNFCQIIAKKGYSDEIAYKNEHNSENFAKKDDNDPSSVDVPSRDGVEQYYKVVEDSESVLSVDSDFVLSSSEERFMSRSEEDSVHGEDSDISDSMCPSDGSDVKEDEITVMPSPHLHVRVEATQQENIGKKGTEHNSFVDEYYLRDEQKGTTDNVKDADKKIQVMEIKEMDGVVSEEKWVLGFIEAIHAAEKRQADLDAQAFHKEQEMLKEKYENELADAKAKELMYAEEVEILDKELFRERVRAEAVVKESLDEAEAKFKVEVEHKEREAELKMKKLVELGKAELAGAVISEKASLLEKIEEANLHINALSMAFNAHNIETQQTQTLGKLALLAHALEDSLSKGLSIKDVNSFIEGKDTVVDLILSSLSKDVWSYGSENLSQLHQKLEGLREILSLYSLMPPNGGGGVFSHIVAHITLLLKVKEKDVSGDGFESAMNKAERLLIQGKLSEAADALEEATRGTQAADVIVDWVKCARNRAIIEQALTFLKSYATSISIHM